MAEAEYTGPSETTDANKFFEKVSTLIENKMKVFENRLNAMEKKMEITTESTKSYSDVVAKTKSNKVKEDVNNFRGIALAARIEEINEESEKKTRERTLVIRGKSEVDDEDDHAFLNNLIKELCIGAVQPVTVMRIGTKFADRIHPIKR